MGVRAVPPEQRVLAGREHHRPQLVLEDEAAGGVVEQQEGGGGGGEVSDDGVEVVTKPGYLHSQSLLHDVFQNRLR